MFKFVY